MLHHVTTVNTARRRSAIVANFIGNLNYIGKLDVKVVKSRFNTHELTACADAVASPPIKYPVVPTDGTEKSTEGFPTSVAHLQPLNSSVSNRPGVRGRTRLLSNYVSSVDNRPPVVRETKARADDEQMNCARQALR